MIVKPMTDTDVDRLRATANAKWIDRGGMWMRPIDVLDLIARLDAERTRADAAEAERDAALARAVPEPKLLRTIEEVEALPPGDYRVLPPLSREWQMLRRNRMRTWALIGAWVQPLPDLPIPPATTAAQEG